ncbi:MAG: TerB family tellurite resistance protein [bacterium]
MSELTREDLKTILQFGIHIAKVDGKFDVWEKKILARFAEAMGLTEAEKEQMTHQQISLAGGLSHLSGQKAKTILWKTLCAVSHSDGETHETEMDFIQKVLDKVGGQIFLHAVKDWGAYEQEVMDELQAHE